MRSSVAASGRGGPSTDSRAGSPALDHLLDERVELRRARLGRQRLAVRARLGPQDAEQAAHLGQRLAARVADRAQRGGGGRRALLGARRRAVGLHDDDRQRVRDDVVQLAGDPGALERGADRGLLIALERQQPVALLQRVELRPARAPPRAERRRQQHGHHRRGRDLAADAGASARSFQRAAASTAPTTAHAVAAAPIRAPGPYATTVYTAISATTSPGDDVVEHRELREAQHADRREHGHGRPAAERHASRRSATENARSTTTSSSDARSLGSTNASSSKPARHASPATGRSSYQRANRDITDPRISGGAPRAPAGDP